MYMPVDDQLNNLTYIIQEKDCDVLVTKWMTRQRAEKLELHMQRSNLCTLVLIPIGSNGGIGHAVTLVGDLIFDSTATHALRFGKESLDWCCANDLCFVRIFMAIKLSWRKHITFEYNLYLYILNHSAMAHSDIVRKAVGPSINRPNKNKISGLAA